MVGILTKREDGTYSCNRHGSIGSLALCFFCEAVALVTPVAVTPAAVTPAAVTPLAVAVSKPRVVAVGINGYGIRLDYRLNMATVVRSSSGAGVRDGNSYLFAEHGTLQAIGAAFVDAFSLDATATLELGVPDVRSHNDGETSRREHI